MQKRTIPIVFRVDEKEYTELMDMVEKAGIPRERFLRKVVSGCHIHEAPPVDFYRLIREINRIGSNIEQILRVANTKHFIDVPRLRKDLDELEAIESELWNLFIPEGRG